MKTIDQAAPGVPLTRADIPLTITESGLYYFTEDLIVPGGVTEGILVVADNVTIDLRGFTLWGPGIDHAGPLCDGIRSQTPTANTHIMDGRISGFNSRGIDLYWKSMVERVTVTNVSTVGIRIGRAGVVRDCTIESVGNLTGESHAIVVEASLVEGNRILNCLGSMSFIETSGSSVIRGNWLRNNFLVNQGPSEVDPRLIDPWDIPSGIRAFGLSAVEDNTIVDLEAAQDDSWLAAIFVTGATIVKGNAIQDQSTRAGSIGILCLGANTGPRVMGNTINLTQVGTQYARVGILMLSAGGVISDNKILVMGLNSKYIDGVLLMGAKNSVNGNEIVADRRADEHAGIRVLGGRNIITANKINSPPVSSFATFTPLSFEGDGSSGSSANYYAGNIMEGVIFEEAGGGTSNIEGTTPAPNVLF